MDPKHEEDDVFVTRDSYSSDDESESAVDDGSKADARGVQHGVQGSGIYSNAPAPRATSWSAVKNELPNSTNTGTSTNTDAGESKDTSANTDAYANADITNSANTITDRPPNMNSPSDTSISQLDPLPPPIETLIINFIESLSARIHPAPPSIQQLSQLFQNFYLFSATHISSHLATLPDLALALPPRDTNTKTNTTTNGPISSLRDSVLQRFGSSSSTNSTTQLQSSQSSQAPSQPLITPEELAARKRARREWDRRQARLEEAVERRVCELLYHKIYQHKSTQDDALDAKLQSKTAALALVGINLVDLGVEKPVDAPVLETKAQVPNGTSRETSVDSSNVTDNNINSDTSNNASTLVPDSIDGTHAKSGSESLLPQSLDEARQHVIAMGQTKYPLGKLRHLLATHKSIVDALARYHRTSSSSADDLLPVLIYVLITLPPEQLHVVSDAHFIQNFRGESRLTGEAAYCLTTLEAAIQFLETVDLASLRADEQPQLRSHSPLPMPGTPRIQEEEQNPVKDMQNPSHLTLGIPSKASASASLSPAEAKASPAMTPKPQTAASLADMASPLTPSSAGSNIVTAIQMARSHRFRDLVVQTPASALGAASDLARSTADQGMRSLSTSLADSYRFVLSKVRDSPVAAEPTANRDIMGDDSTDKIQTPASSTSIVLPQTLEDARKLITAEDITLPESETSSLLSTDDSDLLHPVSEKLEDTQDASRRNSQLLQYIGGSKASSTKHTPSLQDGFTSTQPTRSRSGSQVSDKATATAMATASAASTLVTDTVRNLGSSLNINPMAQFSRFRDMYSKPSDTITATSNTPTQPANTSGYLSSLTSGRRSIAIDNNTRQPVVEVPGRRPGSERSTSQKRSSTGLASPTGSAASTISRPSSLRSFQSARLGPEKSVSTMGQKTGVDQESDDDAHDGGDLITAFPELAKNLPLLDTDSTDVKSPSHQKLAPVHRPEPLLNTRFLSVQDARDLRVGEVDELLQAYQRLANYVQNMGSVLK